MKDAFDTDFAALGLPDHSPFDILSRPKAMPATCAQPKKRGPKPKRTTREKVLASLRDNKADRFNTHILSREELDQANAVRNRGLA